LSRTSPQRVVAVSNDYFGPDIVVAGLMTGRDVLAVRDRIKGSFVILPSVAFKSDEPVMLDGTTHEELQGQLGLPVRALDFDGLARMIEGNYERGADLEEQCFLR